LVAVEVVLLLLLLLRLRVRGGFLQGIEDANNLLALCLCLR
jgi:hypothetical protein